MSIIGEVTRYNSEKAYGYIRELGENGTEQFFHLNSVVGRVALKVGSLVTFEIAASKFKSGKTEAVNVQLTRDGVSSEVRP
jgi:cold shock CspA family protein